MTRAKYTSSPAAFEKISGVKWGYGRISAAVQLRVLSDGLPKTPEGRLRFVSHWSADDWILGAPGKNTWKHSIRTAGIAVCSPHCSRCLTLPAEQKENNTLWWSFMRWNACWGPERNGFTAQPDWFYLPYWYNTHTTVFNSRHSSLLMLLTATMQGCFFFRYPVIEELPFFQKQKWSTWRYLDFWGLYKCQTLIFCNCLESIMPWLIRLLGFHLSPMCNMETCCYGCSLTSLTGTLSIPWGLEGGREEGLTAGGVAHLSRLTVKAKPP